MINVCYFVMVMQIDRELFMYSAMKYPSNKQLLAIVEVIKVT